MSEVTPLLDTFANPLRRNGFQGIAEKVTPLLDTLLTPCSAVDYGKLKKEELCLSPWERKISNSVSRLSSPFAAS